MKHTTSEKLLIYGVPILIICVSLLIGWSIIDTLPKNTYLEYDPSINGWLFFINLFKVPIALLTVGLAIYTPLLRILKYYQRKIQFDKQYELKQEQFEISQRPELIIDELIKHIVESDKELSFSLKCKNNGKSNAKIISYEFTIYKNDTSQGPYIVDDYIRNISPNKESVTLSPCIHEKVFYDEFFKTRSIKVLIKINYQDPMNKTHQTEAQFEYDNQRNKYRLLNIDFHFNI